MKLETAEEVTNLPFWETGNIPDVVVVDSNSRPWIVWQDNVGEIWATSYTWEDDDTENPNLASVETMAFPVLIVSIPSTVVIS